MKQHYRTIVISDVHLGSSGAKAKEVVKFLKHTTCSTLILNGDIIDGWQLKKSGTWKKKDTRFFKLIMKMMARKEMKVIYLRGNHDDFLDEILPFRIANFQLRRDYILKSGDKQYYITHGDVFDSITTNLKWLAKLGDVGYTFLLWLNKFYNARRERKGLPYYSLSQLIKSKVKTAVSYISSFENELSAMAEVKNCQGIITGHIHQPANKMIGNIHYLNSGDWVETLSALVENDNGEWQIVYYHEWIKQFEADKSPAYNDDFITQSSLMVALQ